jgi:hypothetical protein
MEQAAQHYALAKWGLRLTPEEASARVWRDEGMLFVGTLLQKERYGWETFYAAPGCFWSWHDYPMSAPPGATLVRSSSTGVRHVRWEDSYLSNTNFTLRLDAGSTLEEKPSLLTVATRPRREFGPISPAGGYTDWYEYFAAHPDPEGSAAAIVAGDRVARKLLTDGGAEYMGWGFNSDYWGNKCWLSGYFFSVRGLDDETLFGILRWFSTLPTRDQTTGIILPEDFVTIPPEDPRLGSTGWSWHPGLDLYLRDMIIRNGKYLDKHYYTLLQEYKRRVDSGTWSLGSAATQQAGNGSGEPTGIPTAVKVVAGAAAVGGLAWLLLRKW